MRRRCAAVERTPPCISARACFCLQEAAAKKEAEEPKAEEPKAEAKPAVAVAPALVKQLREASGAGMMDCKKVGGWDGEGRGGEEGGQMSPVKGVAASCLVLQKAARDPLLCHCTPPHPLHRAPPAFPSPQALAECGGDLQAAAEFLRKKGLASADKKSGRVAAEGAIGAYIHAGSR